MSSVILFRLRGMGEELLRRNRELYTREMERGIDSVKKLTKKYLGIFRNIGELVKILKACRDEFLSSYTLEIVNSSNHTRWVNEKMGGFNELTLKVKSFLKLLDIELRSGISLNSLNLIISKVPKECTALRKEIEELIKFLEKLEGARKAKDIQQLERLYREMPKILKGEKKKLSNEILRLKLEQQMAEGRREEKLRKEDYDKVEELKQEAEVLYEKLNRISHSDAVRLKPLVEELKSVKDKARVLAIVNEVKYTYARAVEDYVLSDVLKEDVRSTYADIKFPGVKDIVEEFLSKEKVRGEDYESLKRRVREVLKEEQVEESNKFRMEEAVKLICEKLRGMGYSVVDERVMERLLAGEIVEIKTPFGEDYVLRVRFDERVGSLAIRFVRYVKDEGSLSEYERAKDISIAKEWCRDYDKLGELLREGGIILEGVHRIEPEERFYYERREGREERMEEKMVKKDDRFRRQL